VSSARLRRTAAAVTIATLALAACGTNPAGSASVVGRQSVADADVARSVDEVHTQWLATPDADKFDEAAATLAVVQRKTRHLLLAEAGVREGIVVTQAQVDDLIDKTIQEQVGGDRARFETVLATQQSLAASEIPEYVRDFLTQTALAEKLAPGADQTASTPVIADYLAALSADLDVRVAARFGTWDAATVALGPVPDDLSTAAVDAGLLPPATG
jgi:hypothetical protein